MAYLTGAGSGRSDYRTSKRYQDAAARIAASEGIPPVHLDAICWGLRE